MAEGDKLRDRRVKVIVAAMLAEDFATVSATTVEIDNLRVQFDITKTLKRAANTAEVKIWNLAERTRAALQDKGSKVVLSAGYANTIAQVFIGDARYIDHTREGADWVTKIQAGDGERGLGHARVSESFGAGIPLPDVATKIAKKLNFDPSDITKKLAGKVSKQFASGYVAHGLASKELDKVLAAAGYEWSVQDGKIQVLEKGGTNTERVIVLSSDSGLIGSPEHGTPPKAGKKTKKKPPVLKVRSLLMPEIKPGGRVQLESERHKGLYKVLKIKHHGDTHAEEWFTDAELAIT